MKTKLTCPKCGKTFDYEFVPGASLSAIRLGNYRYMGCPVCGKAAMFNITKNLPFSQRKKLAVLNILLTVLLLIPAVLIEAVAFSRGILVLKIAGFALFAVLIAMLIPVFSLMKKPGKNS